MHVGQRKQADGAGTGLAEQWLLPLTGNVSWSPGHQGGSWQTGAALTLQEEEEWREEGRAKEGKGRSKEGNRHHKDRGTQRRSSRYFC